MSTLKRRIGAGFHLHRYRLSLVLVSSSLLAPPLVILLAQADTAPATSGWQAVVDNNGPSIAITGMLIVFAALAIIAGFIAAVPSILTVLEPILPKSHAAHAPPARQEQTPLDQEKVVAAIGLVLHTELQKITNNPD